MKDNGFQVWALLVIGVAVSVFLAVLTMVSMGEWAALLGLLRLLVLAGAVVAAFAGWLAWLDNDRRQLATRIRARRADLDHQRAEALLAIELDTARRNADRARATVERIQDATDDRMVNSLSLGPTHPATSVDAATSVPAAARKALTQQHIGGVS